MTRVRPGRLAPLLLLLLPGGPVPRSEADRIATHLRGAEVAMATRDLAALSPQQRTNRAAALALLADYRRARAFPVNEHFPDTPTPYFRDRHGALCAMAFLLERTGHGDIVDHVAATRNNARLAELADEPGLAAWLDEYGITLAEAARVQPGYGFPGGTVEENHRIRPGFAIASGAGIGTALVGTALTLTSGRQDRTGAWIAAGAGLATATLGAARFSERGEVRQLSVANIIVGGVAALVGIQRLFGGAERTGRQAAVPARPVDISVGVIPGRGPALGATVRF